MVKQILNKRYKIDDDRDLFFVKKIIFWFNNQSIRSKIATIFSLLIALISLFILLYFPSRFETQAYNAIYSKAKNYSEIIAFTISPALYFEDRQSLNEFLIGAKHNRDILYHVVVNMQGSVITSDNFEMAKGADYNFLNSKNKISENGKIYKEVSSIKYQDKEIGKLYIGLSLDELHGEVKSSIRTISIISFIVLILGFLAVFAISSFLITPLKKMVNTFEEISLGDLTQRVKIEQNDEVGHLADSFNVMVDRLERAYNELGSINRELEERVKGRTAALEREIEERIRTEGKYRNIFDNALEGIFQSTAEGRFIDVNRAFARMLGFASREELLNSAINIQQEFYINPKEREELIRILEDKREVYGRQVELARIDGRRIWVSESIHCVYDSEGKLLFYEGISEDITESKRREEELEMAKERAEEMNRLKSSFFANMSHELRTPMVGILGFSELLTIDRDIKDVRENAKALNESARRLMETLNLILDISRIEAEMMGLNLARFDLRDEVIIAMNCYRIVAMNKGLDLAMRCNGDGQGAENEGEFVIFSDRKAVSSILNNLINNGIKFTDRGKVEIWLRRIRGNEGEWGDLVNNRDFGCNEYIELNVQDTGIGIAENDLGRIFEEFRQVSEGFSRVFEGTGLGLTLCKKFVTLLGGTISVRSEPGKGSNFCVLLPVNSSTINRGTGLAIFKLQERKPAVNNDRNVIKDYGKHRILLVEDDEITTHLIKILIKPVCKIEIVRTGLDAIEMARNRDFSAILMDINLGKGMSGLEAAKEIKKMYRHRHTPIIALTAYAMEGDKEEFIREGCTHYLSKPFDNNEFLGLILEILKPEAGV